MTEKITSTRLNDNYEVLKHSSGLTVYLYKMPKYSTTYASISTKYGSNYLNFTQNNEKISTVPGIAHFLEHKLFQNQDGTDAFELFADTGANANAFTSFEKTAYLFACTNDFKKNLDILLDFVFNPYFTPESVEKEIGIIAQEINMYDDEPSWKVFKNLMQGLYVNHPIREDIAGDVKTINEVTADTLYKCYNAFYTPENMVLCVAGDVSMDDIEKICDKNVKKSQNPTAIPETVNEPDQINKEKTVKSMDISIPYFQIGYKGKNKSLIENETDSIYGEMLADIIAGDTSELYRTLYEKGLINDAFGAEVMSGNDYYVTVFSGESKEPEKVYETLKEKIKELKEKGINDEDFEIAKRSMYGRYVRIFSRPSSVASLMSSCHFSNLEMYDIIEKIANAKKSDVLRVLNETLRENKSAISIITPKE